MYGALEYHPTRGAGYTLATRQQLVPNEGDAWEHTLDAVGRYFEGALATIEDADPPRLPPGRPLDHAVEGRDDADERRLNGYQDTAELLGRRTGEMHLALADADDEDFTPEPFSKLYLRSLYQTFRNGVRRPLQTLRAASGRLEGEASELAREVLDRRDELIDRIGLVRDLPLDGRRIRCHGDYHLGQVLWTGKDFYIIDFEGEPMRPLGERRLKRSCLSDVAGMCRSLDYAANSGLWSLVERGVVAQTPTGDEPLRRLADAWSHWAQTAFLRGYFNVVGPPLIPGSPAAVAPLLEAWTLHKAAYEVGYELNNRPDWVTIPLRGILAIMDEPPPSDETKDAT